MGFAVKIWHICNRVSVWDVEEEKESCSIDAQAPVYMHRITEKMSQQQYRTAENYLSSFIQMVRIQKSLGCVYICVR